MKHVKALLFLSLVVLSGCSGVNKNTTHMLEREIGGEMVHDSVTIKPSGSYEECIELRQGLVFDYEFDASDSVDFNIHYHAEDGVHQPVDRKGVTFGKGTIDPGTHTFYTQEQESYCLMWDNLNLEPVKVTFRCVLEQKKISEEHMHH